MSVVPYLTIPGGRGTEAVDFYTKVFDAKEERRQMAEDGKKLMHASLNFHGGTLMMSDDFMNSGDTPALASVFVRLDKPADVDSLAAKAKAAGANMRQEPQDMFWGDRYAQFIDPFGFMWQVGAALAS